MNARITSDRPRRLARIAAAAAAALALAACGSAEPAPADEVAESGLMAPDTLVVGMNLQYQPQMFLDDAGEPSGYDVDLLHLLAEHMGVELDIQNLDFNGLIPGLQAAQFDLVSVGLGVTDEREQVIDFSRGYVPYSAILGVAPGSERGATVADYDRPLVEIAE